MNDIKAQFGYSRLNFVTMHVKIICAVLILVCMYNACGGAHLKSKHSTFEDDSWPKTHQLKPKSFDHMMSDDYNNDYDLRGQHSARGRLPQKSAEGSDDDSSDSEYDLPKPKKTYHNTDPVAAGNGRLKVNEQRERGTEPRQRMLEEELFDDEAPKNRIYKS